jgi:hypothetical protein
MHYMFLMMMTNSLIHDDHTNVFVNDIKDVHLRYGGFLATFSDGKFRVSHSTDHRIELGAVINKINGKSVGEYVRKFNAIIAPITENETVNTRRAAAYLGVYNPFLPVTDITVDQMKVPVRYVRAKRGLFSRDLRKTMQQSIFKLIYRTKVDGKELGVSAL